MNTDQNETFDTLIEELTAARIALSRMPTGPKRYPERDGEPPSDWRWILVQWKRLPYPNICTYQSGIWVDEGGGIYWPEVLWYAELKRNEAK